MNKIRPYQLLVAGECPSNSAPACFNHQAIGKLLGDEAVAQTARKADHLGTNIEIVQWHVVLTYHHINRYRREDNVDYDKFIALVRLSYRETDE